MCACTRSEGCIRLYMFKPGCIVCRVLNVDFVRLQTTYLGAEGTGGQTGGGANGRTADEEGVRRREEKRRGETNLLLRAVVARCAFVPLCAMCAVCAVYAVYKYSCICCCVRYCILIHRCDPLSSSLLGTTSVLRRRGRKSQMGMEACTTTMRYVNPSCVIHPLYTLFIHLHYLHSYTYVHPLYAHVYTHI